MIEARRPAGLTAVVVAACLTSCGSQGNDACEEPRQRVAELEAALAACEAAGRPSEASAPPESPPGPVEPAVAPPPEEPVVPASRWTTQETPDELTGRPIHQTTALSASEFELDFPYQGPQRARLVIREHPRFGNDVMLRIERGQLTCYSSDCRIDVVFDQGEVIRWRANPADGGSSEVIFLTQVDRFRREASRAREIRIAATVYSHGMLTFVFPGLSDEAAPEP